MDTTKKIYFLLLITFALFTSKPVFAQPQTLSFSNLTFEVSTSKEEFLQAEPIPITFKISNTTNYTIIGHWAVDFDFPYIQAFIYRDGKRYSMQQYFSVDGLKTFIPSPIKPSEFHQKTQVIDFGLEKMFPTPGTYQIEFVLQDTEWKNKASREELKANVLTIQIMTPQQQDLEALKFMQRHGEWSDYFDIKKMIADKKVLRAAEEFLLKFGDTTYGDYINLKVAEFYLFVGNSRGDLDPETGEIIVSSSSPDEVIKYLKDLCNKSEFALADRALSYLALAQSKKGDLEKAKDTLDLLKARYPNSEYIRTTSIPLGKN